MRHVPRILPLVAVAVGGVLAVKVLSSLGALPQVTQWGQAFAEGVAKPGKPAADGKPAAPADAAPAAVAAKPAAICAPTAAELAKAAGLSPAELQVLQSLGARRGVLDAREQGLETQLALMAAAEAKVDGKINALNALKAEITALLSQVDARQQAEVDRMVKVFEGMKPKDSAARFAVLNDEVRLPIAAKMKERALSAMLAQMPPAEAKRLTEALAARFAASQALAARAAAPAPAAPQPASPPAQATAPAAPARPAAPPTRTADATPTPAAETPAAKPAAPHRAPRPHRTAKGAAPAKPVATADAGAAAGRSATGGATGAAASPPTPAKSAAAAPVAPPPPAAKPAPKPAPSGPAGPG